LHIIQTNWGQILFQILMRYSPEFPVCFG
jgi:hypothetical protein